MLLLILSGIRGIIAAHAKDDYLTSWYWTSNARINSLTIGNVDADYELEIITGGHFHDSTRNCAQTTFWIFI